MDQTKSIEQIEAERKKRHHTAPQASKPASPSAWSVFKRAFGGGQPSSTRAFQAPPPDLQAVYQQKQREEALRRRELDAAGLTVVERSPDRFKTYEIKPKLQPAVLQDKRGSIPRNASPARKGRTLTR